MSDKVQLVFWLVCMVFVIVYVSVSFIDLYTGGYPLKMCQKHKAKFKQIIVTDKPKTGLHDKKLDPKLMKIVIFCERNKND